MVRMSVKYKWMDWSLSIDKVKIVKMLAEKMSETDTSFVLDTYRNYDNDSDLAPSVI